MTQPQPASTARLHGLDAVRAGALLLGILLHALLPFAPATDWLIKDTQTSWAAETTVDTIHLFRMSLFMMMAGYFGHMVLNRRGPRAYLRDRTVRILLPFLAFWPLVVMPLGLIAAAGASYRGQPPATPSSEASLLLFFAPGQLWFLLILFEIVLLVLGARAVLRLLPREGSVKRLLSRIGALLAHPAGVLIAAAPTAAALLIQTSAPRRGIIEPATLIPEIAPLLAYLSAFLVGWFLHAHSDSLHRLSRLSGAFLMLAAPLTALSLLSDALSLPRAVSAALVAVTCWLWVFGLTGGAVAIFRSERPVIRYIADASYWMYLVHLPVLVTVEVLLADLHLPILAKLGITALVSMPLLLGSYHLLVRRTFLGRWLNGRARPRPRTGAAPHEDRIPA